MKRIYLNPSIGVISESDQQVFELNGEIVKQFLITVIYEHLSKTYPVYFPLGVVRLNKI